MVRIASILLCIVVISLFLSPLESLQTSMRVTSPISLNTAKGCGASAAYKPGERVTIRILVPSSLSSVELALRKPQEKDFTPIKSWGAAAAGSTLTFSYSIQDGGAGYLGKYELLVTAKGGGKANTNGSTCSFFVFPQTRFFLDTDKCQCGKAQYTLGDRVPITIKSTHDAERMELWANGVKVKEWRDVKANGNYSYGRYIPQKTGKLLYEVRVIFNGAQYSLTCIFWIR